MKGETTMKSIQELFNETVRDTYNAEKQIVKALPKMEKAAQNPKLKTMFKEHLAQTQEHVKRLEEICKMLKVRPAGKICHGMEGLIMEGTEHIQDFVGNEVGDAALITCAQKVEHYGIEAYGTMVIWAQEMGMKEIASILKMTLGEEKDTDEMLTQLAEKEVNLMAIKMPEPAASKGKSKQASTKEKVSVR